MNQDKQSPHLALPPQGEEVTRVRSMTAAPKWQSGAATTKRHDLALSSRETGRQDSVDKPPRVQHLLLEI